MLQQREVKESALSDAADWRALEEQLGSPEESTAVSSAMFAALPQIQNAEQLREFVAEFQTKTLAANELPVILRAYEHARRNEARELIELDRSMRNSFASEALANASERVGRNQLRRMRALKTERVVTRYWEAVSEKKASGWHTVVFGVVLAMYSIPLRQGLNHYAHQTVRGFLEAGATSLRLPAVVLHELESGLIGDLPNLVERAIAPQGPTELRCV